MKLVCYGKYFRVKYAKTANAVHRAQCIMAFARKKCLSQMECDWFKTWKHEVTTCDGSKTFNWKIRNKS